MSVSVIDAVGPALERTKQILFKPFDLGKWIALGFCAWLAFLGGGPGPSIPQFPTSWTERYDTDSDTEGPFYSMESGRSWSRPTYRPHNAADNPFREIEAWVRAHLQMAIAIAILVVIFVIAIGLLVGWLHGRGAFMFLDGVVRNRGAVVEPWNQYCWLGNRLFLFRLIASLLFLVMFVALAGLCLVLAWPSITAKQFGSSAMAAIVLFSVLAAALWLCMVVFYQIVADFLVPIMYARGVPPTEAWCIFRRELAPAHFWAFVRFYLLKLVLAIACGIIAVVAICCTCCVAALPYVGTVIMLPLFVFFQCYALYFLRQFGTQWQLVSDPTPLPILYAVDSGTSTLVPPRCPPSGSSEKPQTSW